MTTYHKLIIYFFSGTGNSKNVALWLSKAAGDYQIECEIINIAQIDRLSIKPQEQGDLLAFVSPIHGFNYPPVMLNFIFRFPKGRNNVLLMNTRAGMLIGKFITPGLTGIAFYLSALILKTKGYSIKAMFPVDLPSNWLSLHPGLNERTVKFLHEKNMEKVAAFAGKIFSGKTDFKGVREIIQDIIISPVSLGYYFIGRFALAKTFYASGDCNNCDACLKGCPVRAIKKVDNRYYWTIHCESCMKCMSNCPMRAIETAHGLFFAVSLLYSIILIDLFYKYFNLFIFELSNETGRFIIENLLFLGFLTLSYRITHYLMRFKFIERLMVFTSLTKYKFWGKRYKALKIKEMEKK